MAALRYFGVKLADVELEGLRSDAALGRFVAITDPLPVGTTVELDGAPHRVTRVDEGLTPGFWVWGDGVAATTTTVSHHADAVPESIDAQATVPNTPPTEELSVEAEPAGDAEAVPAPAAAEKSEEGGKKRRRRSKTVLGR